jgi:hypothetical protein
VSPPEPPARSAPEPLPWRSSGTRRSWGGKHELPVLLSRLAAADQPEFEKLARTLLRIALAPQDRLLGEEAFQSIDHGYVTGAGEAALPVFVQPIAFQERSEDLGEAHVLRCRDALERFTQGPSQPAVYLLVHNRDPRSPAFRAGLEREIASLRAAGRVEHALVWDARDLLEAAFDNLFDVLLTAARRGGLSVAPVETALASSADLLSEVPLRVSSLTADQHRLGAGEEAGGETVADPAALLLEAKPTVRTILVGGFGFGKTTAVARSLLREDVRVLYVPGASLTQEVGTAKLFLSRCIDAAPLFADSSPSDREIYERMLRAVIEHLLKDASLPCALVIDGLDESPFLCRGAGLAHLLNNLETVRIPVVLSMRSEYWLSRSGDLQSTAGKMASRGEPRVRRLRKLELLPWRDDDILRFVQRFREARADPAGQERLERLESLVADGRFAEIYGDIPRRPLFLRLIAESAAAVGLPAQRIGRARLFRDWALWKIRRDLRVQRPHLVFEGEPPEEVLETAWQAMLQAAASMTREHEGDLEILPDCSFERVRNATPALERMVDVLALSLQSLLLLSEERSGVRQARVAFAHRAFQEFFLAWFLAEGDLDRNWLLPVSVQEWIRDLRQEELLDPAGRREAERPPGLPPLPGRPLQWRPQETTSRPRVPRAEPADLILHVLERPRGRRRLFDLRLTAQDPDLDLRERPFGSIEMATDPADYFHQHFKEVAGGDALRARGAFLAEQILPPDLRKTLSGLRHRTRMLQIVSDDPWIPWEVLRIEEGPESAEVDGPFLCEAFVLTRWLHPIRQTVYLPLSRIAAVIPRDSNLPHAEQEWEDLHALSSGDGRKVERLPARQREIEEAFRRGEHDGWHFTGHGLFQRRVSDLSEIRLEDGERLTPAHLGGEAKRMGVKRPLVFLNACETARSELSLTEIGGWAPHFLRAGAGAFIGSLWPVGDSRSRDFARVFYAGFTGGLPLGEAVQAARQTIRSEDDPTWLAYAVFAHPRAVCRPVPERHPGTA